MEERTVRHKGKRRRRRKRYRGRIGSILLILSLAIAFIGAAQGILQKTALPSPIEIGHPPANALSGIQQPPATADTDWRLTLVNRWNPIPENYEGNLVEIAGGEQVDERIYEPLMKMLEAAKEGNRDQLPLVVSGYRTQEIASINSALRSTLTEQLMTFTFGCRKTAISTASSSDTPAIKQNAPAQQRKFGITVM